MAFTFFLQRSSTSHGATRSLPMITFLLFVLLIAAPLAEASPEGTAAAQHKGVDLLIADCCHDGRGNLLIFLPDKTPFDSDTDAHKRYLDAYAAGFESGYAGDLSVRHETSQLLLPGELEGWSAGQWTGYRSQQKETLSHSRP